MNKLLEKFSDYKSIVNYKTVYEFEDGCKISYVLKQTDFPHLIGLHKLTDIPVIRQFNDRNNSTISAKYIISRIKKEQLLTEDIIRNSIYFPDIEKRFDAFGKENILTLSYSDAVINFNASRIGSNLKSDYILFEKKAEGYNHLCIAEDAGKRYAESFFFQPSDLYIQGQKIVKVKNIKIYDANEKIYMEDQFF